MLCLWPFVLDISISFFQIEIIFVAFVAAKPQSKELASSDAVSLLFLFLGKEEL